MAEGEFELETERRAGTFQKRCRLENEVHVSNVCEEEMILNKFNEVNNICNLIHRSLYTSARDSLVSHKRYVRNEKKKKAKLQGQTIDDHVNEETEIFSDDDVPLSQVAVRPFVYKPRTNIDNHVVVNLTKDTITPAKKRLKTKNGNNSNHHLSTNKT